MARLMSVAFTEQAVRERRKTVTRRKGWIFLKPGDRLTLCRKVMGRKPGEPLVRLAEVEVERVHRSPLATLTDYPLTAYPAFLLRNPLSDYLWRDWEEWRALEMVLEGFPGMDPAEFVQRFFVAAQGMTPSDMVTRIEWRYLDAGDGA